MRDARSFIGLTGTDWLLFAWNKALVTLRAFQMLSVYVRPLFGRDAVATVRAVSRE